MCKCIDKIHSTGLGEAFLPIIKINKYNPTAHTRSFWGDTYHQSCQQAPAGRKGQEGYGCSWKD